MKAVAVLITPLPPARVLRAAWRRVSDSHQSFGNQTRRSSWTRSSS